MKITDEMVERAARAFCLAEGSDPDEDWRNTGAVMLTIALEPGKEQRWRRYERPIHAALEAALAGNTHWLAPMEATRKMIDAAEAKNGPRRDDPDASAEVHYTAMRDQYLADSPSAKMENTNGD